MASFLLSSPFTRSFPHFSFLDNLHCSSKRISWHQTSLLELHRLFMEWSDGFLPLPLAFSHTHKHTLAYWTIELGPNPAEILITSLPSPRRAKTTRINMWPVFFYSAASRLPAQQGGADHRDTMPFAHWWHLQTGQSEPDKISSSPMGADIRVMQRLQSIKIQTCLINHYRLFLSTVGFVQIGEPSQPDSVLVR